MTKLKVEGRTHLLSGPKSSKHVQLCKIEKNWQKLMQRFGVWIVQSSVSKDEAKARGSVLDKEPWKIRGLKLSGLIQA